MKFGLVLLANPTRRTGRIDKNVVHVRSTMSLIIVMEFASWTCEHAVVLQKDPALVRTLPTYLRENYLGKPPCLIV
jgi:hypothetical protein